MKILYAGKHIKFDFWENFRSPKRRTRNFVFGKFYKWGKKYLQTLILEKNFEIEKIVQKILS